MRSKLLLPSLQAGDTLWCAMSGGADSVAMTHLLRTALADSGVTLQVCHFNHRLRGAESDGDEAFCRELCRQWGLPITVGGADVAAYARTHGEGIEEAARHCRYAFFETLPGFVATAHTADDQLETVLMHLLRGTGLKGLGGIRPERDKYLRPLLHCTRAEILAYLDANGLPHREDSTNAEDDCVRNRLRHQVIPLLRLENPALLAGISRMTEGLQADEALLHSMAEALLQPSEDGYAVPPLRDAPAPLRQRAIRTLLCAIRAPKLSACHIRAVEQLLFSPDPSAKAHLPGGWTAARVYDRLVLRREAVASFAPVTLPCPGEAELPALGLRVVCRKNGEGLRLPGHLTAVTLRPRQTGDTIRLNAGTRELKKLFIDRKIPADLRDAIPVLACEDGVLAVRGIGENLDFLPGPDEDRFGVTFYPITEE